jgi:hypothetical protein
MMYDLFSISPRKDVKGLFIVSIQRWSGISAVERAPSLFLLQLLLLNSQMGR